MDCILTVNGGSSSLKCALFELVDGKPENRYRFKFGNILGQASLKLSSGDGQKPETKNLDLASVALDHRHQACLEMVFNWLGENLPQATLRAIGHRVVHGGEKFDRPIELNEKMLQQLVELNPLAPLHNPFNVKLIQLCQTLKPGLSQIACFDTMFHIGQPAVEREYAIPQQYTNAGIQKYGFHGLSYQYIVSRLIELDASAAQQKIIVCHLGAGASLCAIKNGKSIASTMGFSALDGVPMASRSGAIDPGVLLYLMRHHQMDADALEQFLYKDCGWKGVSGISSDMITLKNSDAPQAKKAIAMFSYRVALEIGKLAAALQGLDQIVFTGGVGENDADLRADIAGQCKWLGAKLDPEANEQGRDLISRADSSVKLQCLATNEELMIARHCIGV